MIPPHHGEGEPRASWRVLTTPVGDLLRGRINPAGAEQASRDWREVVAAADLPPALRSVISEVVGGLRLWRQEKADVARELTAHFSDGLAAGAGADALAAAFGDTRQAARLMTRAKKRSRPAWWRALRRARQAIGATLLLLALLYGYLAAQFWLRSPSITRNYLAELNAAALAAPEEERAWPLYLQAILEAENLPQALWNGWGIYRPGDPEWPQVAAYLDRNRSAIELLHRGAARASLGYAFADQPDPDLGRKRWTRQHPPAPGEYVPPPLPGENPPLFGVLLAHLGELRSQGRLLSQDVFLAAERGDAPRVVAGIEAMVGMSIQLSGEPFLIGQLVSLAIARLAHANVAELLRDHPEALADGDLVRLAHVLSRAGRAPLRFDTERLFLEDLLQRAYTDDGAGGGRLTAEGYRLLGDLGAGSPGATDLSRMDAAVAPLQAAIVAHRAEAEAEYDRLVGLMRASRERPMWEWGGRVSGDELDAMDKRRFVIVGAVLPGVEAVLETAEAHRQHQDGTLAAIALELYHRRNGQYPRALADLAPALLPAVPVDRMDGRPLRYAVRDGKPVLYSVGLDRDDDGGRTPAGGPMDYVRWLTAERVAGELRTALGPDKYDGDLVLWPPPPREPIQRSEEPPPAGA